MRPDLVELVLVIERVQAEDEATYQSEYAVAARRHSGSRLHPANAFTGVINRDERRDDYERPERNRDDRDAGTDDDGAVEFLSFSVDLVPPDKVVDPECQKRPDEPDQQDVSNFSRLPGHSSAPPWAPWPQSLCA